MYATESCKIQMEFLDHLKIKTKVMKQLRKQIIQPNDLNYLLNYVVLVLLFLSQSSCFQHFYQTNTIEKTDTTVIKKFDTENKYIIVHTPTEVFALKNIKVDGERISGEWEAINKTHARYLNPASRTANRFPKKYAEIIFSEVHLYTWDSVVEKGHINLAMNQVYQVDAYGPDKKADKNSKTLSIIGLSLIPVVIIGLGVIAASSISLTGVVVPL